MSRRTEMPTQSRSTHDFAPQSCREKKIGYERERPHCETCRRGEDKCDCSTPGNRINQIDRVRSSFEELGDCLSNFQVEMTQLADALRSSSRTASDIARQRESLSKNTTANATSDDQDALGCQRVAGARGLHPTRNTISEIDHQQCSAIEAESSKISEGSARLVNAPERQLDGMTGDKLVSIDAQPLMEPEHTVEEQLEQNQKRDSIKTGPGPQRKFACPFYKHNPEKYNAHTLYRACSGPGWTKFKDVKGHIDRKHQAQLYCERCYERFANRDRLKQHRQQPQACKSQSGEAPQGVNIEQRERITRELRKFPSDEKKWKEAYAILFPGHTVPDPYHSRDPSKIEHHNTVSSEANLTASAEPVDIISECVDMAFENREIVTHMYDASWAYVHIGELKNRIKDNVQEKLGVPAFALPPPSLGNRVFTRPSTAVKLAAQSKAVEVIGDIDDKSMNGIKRKHSAKSFAAQEHLNAGTYVSNDKRQRTPLLDQSSLACSIDFWDGFVGAPLTPFSSGQNGVPSLERDSCMSSPDRQISLGYSDTAFDGDSPHPWLHETVIEPIEIFQDTDFCTE